MNLGNFFDNPTSQHTDTAPKGTGGGAPSQEEQAQQQPAQQEQRQQEQKKSEPGAPEKSLEQTMYGDTMYKAAETALIPDAVLDGTPEQLAAARVEIRGEFAKLELPTTLARDLAENWKTAMSKPWLSDADHAQLRSTMHAELAQRFGRDGAKEKLADVRALLAKSPAIADQLVAAGLDVDINVIIALAEHARSLRGKGRLA